MKKMRMIVVTQIVNDDTLVLTGNESFLTELTVKNAMIGMIMYVYICSDELCC